MKIKSQRDFWAGLLFVAVGVVFAVGARNYPLGNSAHPGPGYFPLLLSVLMAVLGAVVVFKALTIESEGGDPIGHIAWKPLLVVVAAVALFAATITRLGLVLSLPILVLVSSLASDEFHWRDALVNAVVLTLLSWLLFIVGLKLTIPVWPSFMHAG